MRPILQIPKSGEFMTIKNKMLLGVLFAGYQPPGRTSHRGFDQYLEFLRRVKQFHC